MCIQNKRNHCNHSLMNTDENTYRHGEHAHTRSSYSLRLCLCVFKPHWQHLRNWCFLFFLSMRFLEASYRDTVSRFCCMYKHDVYFTHQKSKSSLCPARVGFPGFREDSLSSAQSLQTVVKTPSQGLQNSWEASSEALTLLQRDSLAEPREGCLL